MVKILTNSGDEEKFDSKDVKRDLEKAGMPERVAEEVAERVEDRVEDHWTAAKVDEQVEVELGRLEEDIQRAHNYYTTQVRSMTSRTEGTTIGSERTQTFVPASDKEEHEHRHDLI